MKINGNKTYIVAGLFIAYTLLKSLNEANGWIVITPEVNETIMSLLGGTGLVTLRQGISKAAPKVPEQEMPGS